MNEVIETIKTELIALEVDAAKFFDKGNAAAWTRVRKAAMEIVKKCKILRDEVMRAKKEEK